MLSVAAIHHCTQCWMRENSWMQNTPHINNVLLHDDLQRHLAIAWLGSAVQVVVNWQRDTTCHWNEVSLKIRLEHHEYNQ